MPRKAKVELATAIDAICLFGNDLKNGDLPPFTNEFYKNVAKVLEHKWTYRNVYTHLRENRRELLTKVFEKLGIERISKKEESSTNSDSLETSILSEQDEFTDQNKSINNDSSVFSTPLLNGEEFFDLVIRQELWKEIQPVFKNYNGRQVLVLPPGVWSDVIADEFWKQYRMPCAFSFKKHTVSEASEDSNTPFITIVGKCKSDKCNNKFFAVAKKKPINDSDLWLQVKCIDTRLKQHEEVKRQLRFQKRQQIGKMVLKDGAANTRRKIAKEMQNIGDIPAPNLYKNEVLRKVLQEVKDKELNVDPKEGNDPISILLMLQNRTPYFGSIRHICASKFQLQYLLPEQIYVYKEYCRLFADTATICIDGTGSLVKKIDLSDNVKSPVIFLYEIVINFNNITLSVGQMLSAAHDTINIAHWLLNWVKTTKTVPREAVSDYSKALLGAMMLSFNTMTLKEYIQICFASLTTTKTNSRRVIKTYIRVDVAHLIQICCRLKCFTKCNKAVKDFFIRCVALMVSCEDFNQFQEILRFTFIMSIHQYDGNRLNSTLPSPVKTARIKLLQLMSTEEHRAMKLIPEETSEEFQNNIKKLLASGFDPNDPQCFINQEPDVDVDILNWLKSVQAEAEVDKNTNHERANAYYMPQFFQHIFNLAKEFPLWTAVNRKYFSSLHIRPTSCYVEGAFGELKNNILNNIHGAIRSDKFFKIDFESSKAQCLIAAAEIAKIQMGDSLLDVDTQKKKSTTKEIRNTVKVTEISPTVNDKELPSFDDNSINLPKHQSTAFDSGDEVLPDLSDLLNADLFAFENWKNKVHDEIPESSSKIVVTDLKATDILQQKPFKKTTLETVERNLPQFPESSSELVVTDLKATDILQQKPFKKTTLETVERKLSKFPESSSEIVTGLKAENILQQQPSKKRKLKIIERKPSKVFRKCPNIMMTQDAAVAAAKINIKDQLLRNGNTFLQPILVNGRKFMLKNSCGFDSISQILTALAIDSPKYLNHIEESANETFGFILVFLEHGAVNHVYGLRCWLLKDCNTSSTNESNSLSELKETPYVLRIVNAYYNITEMWELLMKSEPSLYLKKVYACGHCKIEEISSIFVNHKIIEEQGFQNLQNAVITRLQNNLIMCEKDNCGLSISTRVTVNAHVFIELDVRSSKNLHKSLTCKVEDFPLQINLHGEFLRLGGIITHHGDHYMARCRRLSGRWELYNDCVRKVTMCNKKDIVTPAAGIYIKCEQ